METIHPYNNQLQQFLDVAFKHCRVWPGPWSGHIPTFNQVRIADIATLKKVRPPGGQNVLEMLRSMRQTALRPELQFQNYNVPNSIVELYYD